MDYIHYNPVKHGHVKQASEWPYSSFPRYVEMGMYPENWGGNDMEDKEGFGERY